MDNFYSENYKICPFDPNHVIRNMRMQSHIMKCSKNHTSMAVAYCPFNANHIFPEAERQSHLLHCKDREKLHSKTDQETTEKPGMSGCLELPVYGPVITHGDTWNDNDESYEELEQYLLGQATGPVQKVQIQEQEFEGNPVSSRILNVKGSKSLALLQQQRQAEDSYSQALQVPMGSHIAFGRGQGAIRALNRASPGQQAAASAATATPLSPIRPGGRGQTVQVSFNTTTGQQYRLQPRVPTVEGFLPSHIPSSGDSSYVDWRKRFKPRFSAPAWRGIGPRMAVDGGSGGAPAPMQKCVWQSGDMSRKHRGFIPGVSRYLSGSGIPFGGIASQPEHLVPSLSKMNLSVSTSPFQASSNVENGQTKQLRVSEDTERFVDWVGGGYTQEQAQQCQPSASTSSQSLRSEHEAVDNDESSEELELYLLGQATGPVQKVQTQKQKFEGKKKL